MERSLLLFQNSLKSEKSLIEDSAFTGADNENLESKYEEYKKISKTKDK
jgi:hypothetical protein